MLRKVIIWVAVAVVVLVALWSVLVNFVGQSYLIPSGPYTDPESG